MNKVLAKVLTVGLCCVLLGCGLGTDVTIEAFDLQVVPSPAQEGDFVSLYFTLTVVASGTVVLAAMIDDEEYSTQTAPRLFSGVFEWGLGDAGDLIDRFGLGDHTVQVQVRAPDSDRVATTELVTFTLVATAL